MEASIRPAQEIIEEAFRLHEAGNHAEAQHIYDRLLGYMDEPDANVLHGYGVLLGNHEQWGLALHLLRGAAAAFPDHAATWAHIGICCYRLGRDAAALDAYTRALELEPDNSLIHTNVSGYWINRGHPDKVVYHAQRALQDITDDSPYAPQAHNHLAIGLMEQGRYDEAWPHYEWRWNLPERQKDMRPYVAPLWTGQKVGTLAIHGEQGLGDEIMYMGCLAEAKKRADKVVIECNKRLVNIFAESFDVPCYATHDELILAEGEPDSYIPMGSLPRWCGLPSGKQYLLRMPRFDVAHTKPRIGLTWRGGMDRTHKRSRSLKPEWLKPLLEVPDIDFVSVQYGEWDHEAEAIGLRHEALGRDLQKAQDLIASCDLVITVTQTAVHQAGAMGVDCWVLTPFACSWQFTPAHGDRMIWYDSVRLFRQAEDEAWQAVVGRVKQALEARYRD